MENNNTEGVHAIPQLGKSLYLGVAIVGVLVGLIGGHFLDSKLPSNLSNTKKAYQAGFDAARKLVEESSFGSVFKSPEEVKMVTGTVTAVEGNKISLHLNSASPFDDHALLDRTVLIGASTKITKMITTIDTKNTKIPMSVTIEVSTPASILVGSNISAVATENVKSAKEFTAIGIQIIR